MDGTNADKANDSEYTLLYWPSIGGRVFDACYNARQHLAETLSCRGNLYDWLSSAYCLAFSTPSTDIASHSLRYANVSYQQDLDPKSFIKYIRSPTSATPYAFAPPMLLHNDVLLAQTPNILLYLSDRLGLSGSKPIDKYFV